MKKLFTAPVILLMVLFSIIKADAQDTSAAKAKLPVTAPAPAINTDHTLKGQYRYILTKVYNYQQPLIGAFYKNVTDTLKIERAALQTAQSTVRTQAATIKTLNADASTKDQTISASNARIDEIKLLGISFTKASYNILMWGLVIGFGLALVIVITTTTRFKSEAKYRIKLYDELSSEFQTYKTKANEKEKKLARELQTARNQLDELDGR